MYIHIYPYTSIYIHICTCNIPTFECVYTTHLYSHTSTHHEIFFLCTGERASFVFSALGQIGDNVGEKGGGRGGGGGEE